MKQTDERANRFAWSLPLIAVAFAGGALAHALGLIATVLGRPTSPGYPAWRHAAFMVSDFGIAYLAANRSRLLAFPLLAFVCQQLSTHGVWAWRRWADRHELASYDLVLLMFLISALAVATQHAVSSRRRITEAPRRSLT